MKITLSTILLLLCTVTVFSQQSKRSTYLIVRFKELYDKAKKETFFSINPEQGNPNAPEVYSLIPYKTERDAINFGGSFFTPGRDTSAAYYNYFTSATTGMEYLAQRGWELVSVISEVVSGEKLSREGAGNMPVITVSSRPVYYFRKEVQ